MEYYNYIIILTWAALLLLIVLVFENAQMSAKEKRLHYITYLIVALAAMAEWIGLRYSGDPDKPAWLLRMIKAVDYILTPVAGGSLAAQLHQKTDLRKGIQGLLVLNFVFQVVSVFTGWMVVVDAQHVYSHGPAYIAYIVLYVLIVMFTLAEFALYGRRFRNQNKASLYLTILLALGGIAIQEIAGFRVAYLAMAMAMAMLYIHNAEFVQLTTDDSLREQRVQIMLSQVRPHFIYNSLSCISSLCETDPQQARELTDDFSEYLRSQLDAIETEKLIPFERVLEQIGFYLRLEKARFGDRVNVLYDLREKGFSLPTMTVQPLVENAIRYGICKREEGGTIRIASYATESEYRVEIRDDGVGFDVEAVPADGRSHIGIKNVRERLATYGDKLEIISEKGVGTTATIIVPKGRTAEK